MPQITKYLEGLAEKAIIKLQASNKKEVAIEGVDGFIVTVGFQKGKKYMPIHKITKNSIDYLVCHKY